MKASQSNAWTSSLRATGSDPERSEALLSTPRSRAPPRMLRSWIVRHHRGQRKARTTPRATIAPTHSCLSPRRKTPRSTHRRFRPSRRSSSSGRPHRSRRLSRRRASSGQRKGRIHRRPQTRETLQSLHDTRIRLRIRDFETAFHGSGWSLCRDPTAKCRAGQIRGKLRSSPVNAHAHSVDGHALQCCDLLRTVAFDLEQNEGGTFRLREP
jgi:hypothetical protein